MVIPMNEHKEFFELFKMLSDDDKQNILKVLEDKAEHITDNDNAMPYIDQSMKQFSLVGRSSEFVPMTEEEQINSRVLCSFSVLDYSHQLRIINMLKGRLLYGDR